MARRTAAVQIQPQAAAAPMLRDVTTVADGTPVALEGARLAQAMLALRVGEEGLDANTAGRWSHRRSLAFALTASAVLWLGIAFTIGMVFAK